MNEYFDMGHMREVTSEEELFKKGYYLPHHPVLKASSLTTKTRVVFDGSARTTSGLALNDVLMRGPTVQEDIFSILVRFRKHQYVITADIEKNVSADNDSARGLSLTKNTLACKSK